MLIEIEDLNHVRVTQPRSQSCLLDEHLNESLIVGEHRTHSLDHHFLPEVFFAQERRQIDLCHPAFSKLPADDVLSDLRAGTETHSERPLARGVSPTTSV